MNEQAAIEYTITMSILLTVHIITFSLSIILTTTSLMRSMLGRIVPQSLLTSGIATTVFGALTGGMLLVNQPLGVQCAVLLGYVLAFIAVSGFISKRNAQFSSAAEL